MSRGAAGASLGRLLRDAARLDRTQSDPVVSLRNAIGVAAPLAIGAIAGSAAFGLPSTIGALQTAFADRPGPYRLRMLRMLGTALAASITSGVAVLVSNSDLASAALLLVLGFGAGLLLTGGPSATQVGVAATAAALIIGHNREPASAALHVGVLILAGGIGQTVLAIAAWPLGRHRPERAALAGLYAALAAVARRPPGADAPPPATEQLTPVRQVLYGLGHDHGPSVEAYRVLLDEAERIRRELVVLGGLADRMRDEARAAAVRDVLDATASVLDAISVSLDAGRPVSTRPLDDARAVVNARLAVLDAVEAVTPRAAAARVRSLAGQLRAAVDTVATGASEGRRGPEPETYGLRKLRDPVAILRANLTPDSAVLRHAIRVALLVAGSDLFVRLSGVDRGYWVPLTALVVLRPDFASTFQRSSMRAVGTIVGLLGATALVHFVPGGQWYQVVLVAIFFFGMRYAGPGNLGLSAVSLAALVVVLLAINGVPADTTVRLRAEDTLIGAALALAAMLLVPLWERELVPSRLGDLLAAYRNYLAAVSNWDYDPPRMHHARAASRLARTNARASVDRARSEPVRGQPQVELGETVLAHSHRFIAAALTLDTLRPAIREAGGSPELAEFLTAAARVLSACEQAVRGGRAPRSVAPLRPVQERLVAALAAEGGTESGTESGTEGGAVGGAATAAALIDASDRITNSLDTLVAELRRQLAPRPATCPRPTDGYAGRSADDPARGGA
jgi:uncharacterized membrane protein YccC